LLGNDDLENVLVEPGVSHHEITLLTGRLGPRVLNAESDGLARIVEMNGCDNHCYKNMKGEPINFKSEDVRKRRTITYRES